jgi:hypothetical protein
MCTLSTTVPNKKILSFDVGIKNLAYCLIEKDNCSEKFCIKKWDIINLSENTKLCHFITNKKTECGKVAQFQITNKINNKFIENNNNTSFYVCKAHQDKFQPEFESTTKSDIICCIEKCNSNAIENVKGYDNCYSWCSKHQEKSKKTFLQAIKKKKVTGTSCMKQSLQYTVEKLYKILDSDNDFLQVSEILIENQPTLKNPTMKTIASILFSYFVIRGIVEKSKTNSLINEVKFISPSNKLKVNKNESDGLLKKAHNDKTNVYKMTKKLGIKYCTSLISVEDQLTLKNYKKKDDLCDAFLQGFQYLYNYIPDEYLKKLEIIGLEKVCHNDPNCLKKTCEQSIILSEETPKKIKKINKKSEEKN